jgi:hypothetical protein
MSLPQELLDQLLSGYLDDALPADERIRVEQLLQSDPKVAQELRKLQDLRHSLQGLARADSDIKLDRGFADRVLGAAVARAREEGLSDDHPLIRLAEQPSTSASPRSSILSNWQAAAVLVGLAASILIAVLMLRPESDRPQLLTQSDSTLEPESTGVRPPLDPRGPEADGSLAEPGPMIARSRAADETGPDVQRAGQGETLSDSQDTALAQSAPPTDALPRVEAPIPEIESSPEMESAVAANRKSSPPQRDLADVSELDPGEMLGGAILVLEVVRTEAGRESNAVARAMKTADIIGASRMEVTDKITDFFAANVDDQAKQASVLYLQLPAKQFDLFYQQLWADEQGVESVRMALAMNAPVVTQVVNVVQPEAIRHEQAVYELFSRNGVIDQLATALSQVDYPDFDRSQAPVNLIGSGADIQARVLVLVR